MEIKKGILKNHRKVISFIISLIILSGLISNVGSINNNIYIDTVNAASSNSSNGNYNNNKSIITATNNNTNSFIQINKEQNQSAKSKTHEYTLIAENTTLEIAPGLLVDAWT